MFISQILKEVRCSHESFGEFVCINLAINNVLNADSNLKIHSIRYDHKKLFLLFVYGGKGLPKL